MVMGVVPYFSRVIVEREHNAGGLVLVWVLASLKNAPEGSPLKEGPSRFPF